MIALMVAGMAQKTEQIINAQDNALKVVTQKVRNENELIMMALGATMAGAISLQEHLVSHEHSECSLRTMLMISGGLKT